MIPNRKRLISRLTHYINFLENTSLVAMEEENWQIKLSCYAEITSLSDAKYGILEGMDFGNFITEEYYLFRIRYLEGVGRKMRIGFKNKQYAIKRIVNVNQRDKILNIIAQEIV